MNPQATGGPAEIAVPAPREEAGIFYGWWIVGASFLIQFTVMGTTFYSFGVLLKPLTEALGR